MFRGWEAMDRGVEEKGVGRGREGSGDEKEGK